MDHKGGARSEKQMWRKIGIVVRIKATKGPCSPPGMCPESTGTGGLEEQSPCLYDVPALRIYLLISQRCPQRVKVAFPVASEYGFRCG